MLVSLSKCKPKANVLAVTKFDSFFRSRGFYRLKSTENKTATENKKKNVHDKSTITSNSSLSNKSISTKQNLYTISEYSPGSIFFLPNGTKIFNKLINFIRVQETQRLGFKEVITPLMYKKELFEISNHWKYYNEDMFKIHRTCHTEHEHEDEIYALKPMNCPGHCLLYKQFPKSLNDLPVKFSDFSSLHRNESTGSLSGLTRVRRFHQDDGHIFCTLNHLEDEIMKNLKLIELIYTKFGLGDFKLLLSTRPKDHQFIGNDKDWETAEDSLKSILNKMNKPWEVSEGDGAFYGPKIDIILKDKFDKFHQTATIQLDFQLPQKFELKFLNPETKTMETPIIIHRAIFGSVERFLAILIDNYSGKWPFWLNANQLKIVPVSPEKHLWYCKYIEDYLMANGISERTLLDYYKDRELYNTKTNDENVSNLAPLTSYEFNIEIDDRAEPLNKRIKDSYQRSFNYLITIGDKECENAIQNLDGDPLVSVKALYGEDKNVNQNLSVKEVLNLFIKLEKQYL